MFKAAKVYKRYQKILQNQNMLDFDDMLFFVWKLWNENPDILKKYQDIYTHLLVDEYQDTNHAQFEIIRLLAGESMNLCVVGDDDQSIYGWRGAVVENILKFPQHFPGAKEIKLEQNYRSTNIILSTANEVISGNSNRYNKKLWSAQGDGEKIRLVQLLDGEDEAQFIADAVSEAVSENPEICYGDIAILYRSNHMSQTLEQAFRNARIPYRLVGGQEFFKRKEVRDAVAYLKLLVNPRDDQSLLRILGVPPRGIGDKAIDILKELHNTTMIPLSELLGNSDFIEKLSSKAAQGATELSSCLNKYRGIFNEAGDLPSKTEDFLNEIGYLTGLQKIYKNITEALVRQENVKSFIDAVARFEEKADGRPTLSEFLESFSLLDENDRTDDSDAENSVTFLTVHASKGLEFPYVFIMGMEAGTFPHDRSIQEGTEDEERRLFYVAITRAKQNLVITNAEKRMKFSRLHKKRIPMTQKKSKFLKEMPKENTERLERDEYFKPMDKSELNKQFEDIFAILDDI